MKESDDDAQEIKEEHRFPCGEYTIIVYIDPYGHRISVAIDASGKPVSIGV